MSTPSNSIEKYPLISILMPAKNVETYIGECIESILAQTYENWELLIVNDHSSDSTKLILLEYALNDSRIGVLDNSGSGIIDALQLAFENCIGDYITRMDSDDKMSHHKLEKLISPLIESGNEHVSTGLVEYFSDDGLGEGYMKYESWLNNLTREQKNYSEIYKECVIASPCWMVHRDDLIKVGGFVGPYPEDYDLCFRFRNNGLKVIGVSEVLHYWRDYDSRTSRVDSNYADNSFIQLKVYHFVNQDFDEDKKLILWGAGKKGKSIAKSLIEYEVEFDWVCDNSKKIGHNIYGKILLDVKDIQLLNDVQYIVGIAQKGAIEVIKSKLKGGEVFYFC